VRLASEKDQPRPAAAIALDESQLITVRLTDPKTGARLLLDNRPTPRVTRPENAFWVGEVYLSSTPLEIRGLEPKNSLVSQSRRDSFQVRNVGEKPLQGDIVFSVFTETDRLLTRSVQSVDLLAGGEHWIHASWTPQYAGALRAEVEYLQDGVMHTRAEAPLEIDAPVELGLHVLRASKPVLQNGLPKIPVDISINAGAMKANVYAANKLAGSGESENGTLQILAQPHIGYYDVDIETAGFHVARRIIATTVDTEAGRLRVNGEPFVVKGVNVHGFNGGSPARTQLEMERLQALGFNAWRGDYPGRWQTDLAFALNSHYSVLGPFSCASTDGLAARVDGPAMAACRALSRIFLNRYKESAGVLLWNSCNEIGGETTDFILSQYPVYKHLDPAQRPVHYANLFGQDRWQGQDVMAINYYFANPETAEDRHPIITRSMALGLDRGLPVIYTEFNSYYGSVHSTGADAVRGLFGWGVEQGMSGGFFYMRYTDSSHPSVFDRSLNTHKLLDDALIETFGDAKVHIVKVANGQLQLSIQNKRWAPLRKVILQGSINGIPFAETALDDLAPRSEGTASLPLPENFTGPGLLLEGTLTCETNFGIRSQSQFRGVLQN
jgi:hypothetical protein